MLGGHGGWGVRGGGDTKYCVVRFNVLIHEMLFLFFFCFFLFFFGGGGGGTILLSPQA